MRYASIRSMDISNGEGVGISLFVQGCRFCCKNCFNKDTWDFNGGKEWTQEVEDKFIELASRPYIKRISILGGEPLADENLDGVLNLVIRIRLLMPSKTIWLYTGYSWREIFDPKSSMEYQKVRTIKERENFTLDYIKRQAICSACDVVIDGKYVDKLRDITLKWRGSSNQKVINAKESLKQKQIVLYCD